MFKSSGSPSLSFQKQLHQFNRERGVKSGSENQLQPRVDFFFLDLARRGISDLSVLEVAQCAFISNQHGKQTLTDLFLFFTFCSCSLSLSLTNYGKTRCTNILVLLVGFYIQLHHWHTYTNTNAHTYSNKYAQNDANNRQLQ